MSSVLTRIQPEVLGNPEHPMPSSQGMPSLRRLVRPTDWESVRSKLRSIMKALQAIGYRCALPLALVNIRCNIVGVTRLQGPTGLRILVLGARPLRTWKMDFG